MPKRLDYGHPVVRLEFAPREVGTDKLRVRIVDDATGELLMSEALNAIEGFLQTMGYKWIVGSNGKWTTG